MLTSDEHAMALADRFYSAALGAETWYSALDGLATATGSRTGQLIAIGGDARVPINVMTNTDPDLHPAFAALRGGDPAVNPRVRAGMNAPILRVLAEKDFISPEDYKVHPHYEEFARPWDIPYICLATLDRREGLLVGLAVNRSELEGHISTAEREVFATFAPHVRAAVRMQMMLEEQGRVLISGILETLSLPAFCCDASGQVRSMTQAAATIVSGGRTLKLKGGRLKACDEAGSKSLSAAIEAAARSQHLAGRMPQTVVVRSTIPAESSLVLDVFRLPTRPSELNLHPQVLVISHGRDGTDARRRVLLQGTFKLTEAETHVALLVAKGNRAEDIASSRNVAVGTVRAQIKSVLAKLGVRRQVELVAKLAQL